MSGSRRAPDWFERHDAELRELAWLGAVAGAPHPSTLGSDTADIPAATQAEPDEVVSAERAASSLVESKLEEAVASLEEARADLAAARAESSRLEGELLAARGATSELATRMRDDAEAELVKLAIAIAERVVGRELELAPALIVEWAREAVAGTDLGGSFVIATSPDLSSAVADAAWGEMEDALRMDPALPAGTCEVRDGGRTVVVSAAERLDAVSEDLAHVGEAKGAKAA